jgi:hypothetical protein
LSGLNLVRRIFSKNSLGVFVSNFLHLLDFAVCELSGLIGA